MPTAALQSGQTQQPNHLARPGLKKRHTNTRPVRPAVVAQRTSYHGKRQSLSHQKDLPLKNLSADEEEYSDEDDEDDSADMASSFLQFCATCEKQIHVPNSSVLYCSDRCKRKDLEGSRSYTIFNQDASSPSTPPRSPTWSASIPLPIIIPQLSPTVVSKPVSAPLDPITLSHPSTSTPRGRSKTHRPSTSRSDSEAARYLSQFHSPSHSPSRPQHARSTTASDVPALSHTPSTSSSSSVAAYTPISTSYNPFFHRPNRWSASFSSRSVDLITPVTQYPTAPSSLSTVTDKTATGEYKSYDGRSIPSVAITGADALSYEKKRTISTTDSSPGRGSLKEMFKGPERAPAA